MMLAFSGVADWTPPATLADLYARLVTDGRSVIPTVLGSKTPCGEPYRMERGEGDPMLWRPSEAEAVAAFWTELGPDLKRPGTVWWRSLPQIRRRLTSTSVAITGRWLVSTTPVSTPLREAA